MRENEEADGVLNSPKNSIDANDSTDASCAKTIYYGVYIPADVQVQETDTCNNVFDNKVEALKLVKKYKKARFKAFDYNKDAEDFAENGAEFPMSAVEASKNNENPSVGEKHSPFRGPTSQNLVKLRKGIETGDVDFVQRTIWENPRYLIGAGDTPSILQEGFRYNALHVSAKAKDPVMCELILNTISNIAFIQKLYVDDKEPEERAKILLDLYLNTPDKGLNETPLHFAVKFGAPKCVEVFVSFPQCDKTFRNKHGKLPQEIICDRYDGPDVKLISEQIACLLDDNYYVPVLRSEDNCAPPMIGEPFSTTSPPNLNPDPLSPRMEIHAYAGPMNKEGAERFRKIMKTPPRVLNFDSPLQTSPNIASLKLKDHEKGLERMGNDLARRMDVPWKEYWPFLDSFVDLASPDGLQQFEHYLSEKVHAKYNCDTPLPTTAAQPVANTRTEHATQTASNRCVETSPITELCQALQACILSDNSYTAHSPIERSQTNHTSLLNGSDDGVASLDPCHESPLALNPTLCVEKALQVFAKRIANDIVYLIEAEYDTCTLIEAQVRQLQLLMASYRCDSRFASVDTATAHGRLACLIKAQLAKYVRETSASHVLTCIAAWLECSDARGDCFSSDDEGVHSVAHSRSQHTVCLLKSLREFLNTDSVHDDVATEAQCVDAWRRLQPCSCTWERKAKKLNGSRRLHVKHKVASMMLLRDLPRKLSFEENNPDADISMANGDASSSEDMDEDSEMVFYTPPESPSFLEDASDDDGDDVFLEAQLPDDEVFIEGDIPTKIDYAAFNALKFAGCDLNSQNYPNICRWHHAMGLCSETERFNWTSPNPVKRIYGAQSVMSSPVSHRIGFNNHTPKNIFASPPSYAPQPQPQSWLRITGPNSPSASLKLRRAKHEL